MHGDSMGDKFNKELNDYFSCGRSDSFDEEIRNVHTTKTHLIPLIYAVLGGFLLGAFTLYALFV